MIFIVRNPTKKLVLSVFHEVLHSRAALAIETSPGPASQEAWLGGVTVQDVGLAIKRLWVRIPVGRYCLDGLTVCGQVDRYKTNHQGQLNLLFPTGYVNRVPACLAGVKAGRVHLCRWQVALCDLVWQVTLRSSDRRYRYPLGSTSPPYERIKFGYPLENVRFLLQSTNLAREWLQIDTDLPCIRTSTHDGLSGSTNIDDLERP